MVIVTDSRNRKLGFVPNLIQSSFELKGTSTMVRQLLQQYIAMQGGDGSVVASGYVTPVVQVS